MLFFSKVVCYFIALKKRAFVIFCSMRPLVASREKTSSEMMPSNVILIIFKYKILIEFFSHFDSPTKNVLKSFRKQI